MRFPLLLLATVSLAGCTAGADYVRPEIALTPQFLAAPAIAPPDADWWAGFGDPLLERFVAAALANNTDLAQARARMEQSRAAAKGAGAVLLPSMGATGDATSVSQSRETPVGKVTQILGLPRGYSEYAVGTQASWEIDLFGGLRRGREAARAELGAAEASEGAMRIAVAAETADAYLTLRALQARLAIAASQEGVQARLADLVRQRVGQGIAAERELNRATGAPPGANRTLLAAAGPIPRAPTPAGSAAPADLLRRRPDVVAAERRLAAANARIGVALADYYPHLSLSGLLGVASLGTGNLFTGGAVQASGGAGLRWRLFDFGRVDAEVAQARGARAAQLAAWRGSVLAAAEDVETALSRLAEAQAEGEALARQVAALTIARAQAEQAYRGGVTGLIDVLDADRELLAARDRAASVQAEQARAAVAAYRALGGGWAAEGGGALALQAAGPR